MTEEMDQLKEYFNEGESKNHSNIEVMYLKDSAFGEIISLTDRFEEITNIEVNTTGQVIVYSVEGITEGQSFKQILTLSGDVVSWYYIY